MSMITAARWPYHREARSTAEAVKRALKPRRRRRLELDVLEDRTSPAVLTINGLGDDTTSDSTLTLREAVDIIDGGGTDPGHNGLNRALTAGELAEISGALGNNDTIQFAQGPSGTITLSGSQLALTNPVSIQGPGSGLLAISGNGASRVFAVMNSTVAVSIHGLTVTGGSGGAFGGGLFVVGGTVNLSDVSFTGDTANTGGAIYALGGSVNVTNSTFTTNIAPNQGGAIDNDGGAALTVADTSFSGNTAVYGAGISNQGTMTLSGSTLANNTASFWGGAVYNSGTLDAINDTIHGNSAAFAGGALYSSGGTTTLTADTISANQANSSDGGGISADHGTVALQDTLVAGNTLGGAADDIDGTLVGTSAFNLIGAAGSINLVNGSNGNQIGTAVSPLNPRLAALGSFGGTTRTQPLLAGSPALAAGTSLAGLTTDQRGVTRGGAVNIGAFQATASALRVGGFPSPIRAGGAGTITITALDSFGQVAVGDHDSLTFTSTDAAAALPVGAALTAGTGSFSATLSTAAIQSITATDAPAALSGTQSGIVVTPRALPTTTAVAAAPNPSTYGDVVSFTAAVSASTTAGSTPTGTVQFEIDAVAFGAPVALAGGVAASPSIATLSAGSHTITAVYVNTDGNFLPSSGAATGVVNPAPLAVTANDAVRAVGEANPAFTASYKGFVNGDGSASLHGTLAFTTPADQNSPAGPYPIVPSGVSSSDYAITFISGTLTVTPASATPAFSDLAAPTIVFGKPQTALGGKLTAGSAVPSGSITITVQSDATGDTRILTARINPTTGAFAARFRSKALQAGSYTVTFTYPGDATHGATQATTQLLVTYAPESLNDLLTGESGATLRISIEVDGFHHDDVSRKGLEVTAVGISEAAADLPTMPATGAQGSSTDGPFRYRRNLGDSGGYRFSLKLVNADGVALAPGAYKFYFQIGDDPLVHALSFRVVADTDDSHGCR